MVDGMLSVKTEPHTGSSFRLFFYWRGEHMVSGYEDMVSCSVLWC